MKALRGTIGTVHETNRKILRNKHHLTGQFTKLTYDGSIHPGTFRLATSTSAVFGGKYRSTALVLERYRH
jgi:hypothetical protein